MLSSVIRHSSLVIFPLLLAACATTETSHMPGPPPARTPELESAITYLVDQAKSPDAATRANAIEALQDLRDPRAARVIETGLYDPQWVVRFSSAMAAASRKPAELKPKIAELLHTESNLSVRAADIFALYRLGDTSHINELAGDLVAPEPSVRANAALIIGLMGDRSAIRLLRSRHKDPDPRVNFEITAALARLGDAKAMDVIKVMVLSKYVEDQWNALSVCGDLPREVAADPLLVRLKEAPKMAPETPRADVYRGQLLAARALGKLNSTMGGNFILDPKNNFLHDPSPEIRALAALALGEILNTVGAPRLHPLLNDPDPKVRLAASAAVVNIWSRAEAGHGR